MDKHIYYRNGLNVVDENQQMIIRGYAVVFDELTDRAGYFKEKIEKTAFDNVDLSEVVLIVGHDFKNLLAKNGVNMRLVIDDVGLWFEAYLPDIQLGRDTYELVKSEILTGMSFGFMTNENNIHTDFENNIDTILKIDKILEITLTPIPAYPQTIATAVERKQVYENQLKRKENEKEINKKIKILEVI